MKCPRDCSVICKVIGHHGWKFMFPHGMTNVGTGTLMKKVSNLLNERQKVEKSQLLAMRHPVVLALHMCQKLLHAQEQEDSHLTLRIPVLYVTNGG